MQRDFGGFEFLWWEWCVLKGARAWGVGRPAIGADYSVSVYGSGFFALLTLTVGDCLAGQGRISGGSMNGTGIKRALIEAFERRVLMSGTPTGQNGPPFPRHPRGWRASSSAFDGGDSFESGASERGGRSRIGQHDQREPCGGKHRGVDQWPAGPDIFVDGCEDGFCRGGRWR